jgi:hypothetical protein
MFYIVWPEGHVHRRTVDWNLGDMTRQKKALYQNSEVPTHRRTWRQVQELNGLTAAKTQQTVLRSADPTKHSELRI